VSRHHIHFRPDTGRGPSFVFHSVSVFISIPFISEYRYMHSMPSPSFDSISGELSDALLLCCGSLIHSTSCSLTFHDMKLLTSNIFPFIVPFVICICCLFITFTISLTFYFLRWPGQWPFLKEEEEAASIFSIRHSINWLFAWRPLKKSCSTK